MPPDYPGGVGVNAAGSGHPGGMDVDVREDLRRFVLDRLAEDERRLAEDGTTALDDAEGRGRLRIVRADDGKGLLLLPGASDEDHAPVPFAEKAALLRDELEAGADDDTLRLLATAYDTHHAWQEEWRPQLG
ncbi:hypothetical protein GCM10010492_03280 [Saccharothrix mutabilis subsp. mutabilis]|uniref:Uncharacterized protein n=2 Tax=Saccharothrix mutabilis TaxID=33921 RepID=A0ABP3CKZ8_9PSEU